MRALTVDFEMIAQSMRELCRETDDYFFDRSTGKVIGLSKRLIRLLAQEIREDKYVLPDWDRSMIPLAREIVLLGSSNFIRIPEAFGRPQHRWMVKFSSQINSNPLKKKLLASLRGRGSTERFKEILKIHPLEWIRWEHFLEECWEGMIQRWLESFGILAIRDHQSKRRAAA